MIGLGCSSAAEDVSADGSNLEASCDALSPQFSKIKQLVEPLDGHMGSYFMTVRNEMSAEPLLRGTQVFAKMADLIEEAEEEVLFQTWRWDNDGGPANLLLDGIKRLELRRKRASDGKPPVVIRLLINAIAFSPADQMVQLGKRIEDLKLDPKLVDVRLAEFVAVQLGANHSKTLVVDSRKAVVTGTNASRDNAGPPPIYWDVGYVFEGEIARALHNDYATGWADGELWTCGSKAPPRVSSDPTLNEMPAETCRRRPDIIPQIDVKVPASAAEGLSCIPMMVVGHKERIGLVLPDKNDNPQNQAFIGMFAFAEKRIRIQTPNLNDATAKNAILAAIRSGIVVELLLSKKYEQLTESIPGRGGNNDVTVDWLHSIAYEIPDEKRCRLLQIRWFSNDGKTAEEVNGPPSSHVKYMSIDGKVLMVGSANQDVQSWQNSRETNVVIDSAALTKNFDEKVFEVAWKNAIPVDRCLAYPADPGASRAQPARER